MKLQKYSYNGKMLTLKAIAKLNNMKYVTLRHKVIYKGETLINALNIPVQLQQRINQDTKIKVCTVCKTEKPLNEFYQLGRRTGNEYQSMCKQCNKLKSKIARDETRKMIIEHYSNKSMQCSICGENRIATLDLDHINGGGNEDRKGQQNHQFYMSLIKNNFPAGYRILCRNCNWIEHLKLHQMGEYYV